VTGTPQAIREWLMSLQPDSPASPSLSPESKREPTTNGICGPPRQPSLELSNPDSFCLKTCRESVPTCPWLSETCADLGMKFQGPSSLGLMMLGHRTGENGCGLLRTCSESDALRGVHQCPDKKAGQHSLVTQIGKLPTASCRDHKGGANWENRKWNGQQRPEADKALPDVIEDGKNPGLKLQPAFVEWMMGWPIGWTDLKPLGMDKFRCAWLRHGGY
jgi:hypothetical protein